MTHFSGDDPLTVRLRRARLDLRHMQRQVEFCAGADHSSEREIHSMHQRIIELHERATRLLRMLGDA